MLGFYIGSYASKEEKGILFCKLNPDTGEMKIEDGIAGIANPSFLALNKDRTRLYSVSEEENFQGEPSGGLASYKIVYGINIPHLLNTMPSMGKAPCHISLSPDEKFLFAANYTSGNISSYFLNDDGSLKVLSDTKQHHGSSLNPERQEGPHAHMIQPTQDGNFVVTADLGMDQLLIYGFDSKKGKFIDLPEKTVKVTPGQGPRHFIFHPNHPRLYLINELGVINVGGKSRDILSFAQKNSDLVLSDQIFNCSTAAALNVSAATIPTLLPSLENLCASLPIVVVFPLPFTPIKMNIVGLVSSKFNISFSQSNKIFSISLASILIISSILFL